MRTVLLVGLLTTAALGYMNGTPPQNADIMDVLAQWERYKHFYITSENCPNPRTMARVLMAENCSNGEYQGYGLQLASMLERDDALMEKLWLYAKHYADRNAKGVMPWWINPATGQIKGTDGTAADGCMDISMGLDRAALRWGGSWPSRASGYTTKAEFHYKKFASALPTKAIKGTKKGYYTNYMAVAHFDRFSARTGNNDWKTVVLDDCYKVLQYSYDNYRLPAWMVNARFRAMLPNDPFGTTNKWRFDAGASRTAWRLGTHALVSNHTKAMNWAERIIEVFVENGAEENIKKVSGNYNTQTGVSNNWGARPTTMSGAGVCAMAVGNEKIAEEAWDYLAQWKIGEPHEGMSDAMDIMGMCIMSGLFTTSEDVSAIQLPQITTPPVVEGLAAEPYSSTMMQLHWNKVPETFWYKVEMKQGAAYETVREYVNRNHTELFVSGLSPNSSYEFKVTAYNTAGTGPAATVSTQTPAVSSGEVVYAINVGGGDVLGASGIYYQADKFYSGGKANPRYFDISGTEDDDVYSAERFGSFSYAIPVENSDYNVTIQMAESFHTEPGKRLFNMTCEGKSFAGVDIVNEVGSKAAYDETFPVSVSDGTINLNVSKVVDNGSIVGIIVRRPGQVGLSQPSLSPATTLSSLRITRSPGNIAVTAPVGMNRVSLMNAGGQLLATRHGARGQTLVFDASTVPAGPCFVVAGNSEGDKLRKLIIAY